MFPSRPSYSAVSGLERRASGSLQGSPTNGLTSKKSFAEIPALGKPKKESPRKDDKLSKEGIKPYPRMTSKSHTTGDRRKITKKEIKKETKPINDISKKTDPTRIRTDSPKKGTGTQDKVTKSHGSRTNSTNGPVKNAGPKRNQFPRNKSRQSVTSKISSRHGSQSFPRDDIFRNYPLRSSFFSFGSAVSILSSKSQKSQKIPGFWGPNKIRTLKSQPRERETLVQKTQLNEQVSVHADSRESLKVSDSESVDLIPSSEFEEEATLEAESRERIREPEERHAERNAFLQIFGSQPDIDGMSSTETLGKVQLHNPDDFWYVKPVDQDFPQSDKSMLPISSLEEIEMITETKTQNRAESSLNLQIEFSDDETVEGRSLVDEPQMDSDLFIIKNVYDRRKTGVGFERYSTTSSDEPPLPIDQIEAFIDDLLQQAAKLAYKPRMCRILDPDKLIDELGQLAIQYQDTLEKNQCLDKTITEYFVRRKEFAFIDEKGPHDKIHRPRLMKAINAFDFNLKREKETRILTENLLDKLRRQEQFSKAFEAEKVKHFEGKVRETLLKPGCHRLNLVINDLFRMMNEVRNELSKSRQKFTFVQHQLSTIESKSEKMKDLESVSEYLTNQAVTQTLYAKICERDGELNRLKDRLTYDIHTMAQLKEKDRYNRELLQQMKEKLKSQKLRQKELRDLLYDAMLQRKRVIKETENVRRGCLIPYPDMLRDYDATEEHLLAKQKVIQKLRSEHSRLERKLSNVESEITEIEIARTSGKSLEYSGKPIDVRTLSK